MKKVLISLFLLMTGLSMEAQIISSNRWTDLFSYNNILTIKESNGKFVVATENGIFYYSPSTGEITKLSKANGLHEVKITAFDYNPQTQIGLVGYKNGSMDVITPDGITLVVDIPLAAGFSGDKKINHISIDGNRAVISVAYGVSIFNLDKKEFGDTAFFTGGAGYVSALESVIKDNTVYSATPSGLYTHEINTTFPVFTTWTLARSGNFKQIATNGTKVVVADQTTSYIWEGSTFNSYKNFGSPISDVVMAPNDQVLFSCIDGSLYEYNTAGNLVRTKNYGEQLNTGWLYQDQFFAGTLLSGIINESGNSIRPDGPYSNISYKLDLYQNQILVSTGGRDSYNNGLLNKVGYYRYDGSKWNYPEMFKTNLNFNVLDAVINRNNPSEVFFVHFESGNGSSKGIYKMNNDVQTKFYPASQNDRIVGLGYDEDKNLFASTSFLPWSGGGLGIGFYNYNAGSDSFQVKPVVISGGVQKPILHEGVLYIPSPYYSGGGMLIYDYKNTPSSYNDDAFKILKKENGLPVDGTVSAAVDKNGDLWIGSRMGLRVLSDPIGAITDTSAQAQPIIIEQNGIGEELFRDGHVLQISVDSGNQKWVSIDGGGVYYLSPDGEKTFQHFTRVNSPLPTDVVTDVKVDDVTGKVYFATYDGIVVYQSDVVSTTSNFGDVLVYPNPVVYAQYKGNVRIRGLAQKTNIRITDAAGNLVHAAVAKGGFYEWNLNNQRGVRVASGIYYVLMTNEDGSDKATAKIAVVN